MSKLTLTVLDMAFTIHRLAPDADIPPGVGGSRFYWVGKTDEALSIVCDAVFDLPGGKKSPNWSCFKVAGPIEFTETGILSEISAILAAAGISIFALSTFDTDYILVPAAQREHAVRSLRKKGHQVDDGTAII